MNDLISRQAAIDAVNTALFPKINTAKDAEKALRNLPSAQPSATDTNVATTDSISRAAVVDAIEGVDWYHINKNGKMVHGANNAEHQAWYKADDIYAAIERVPSTQSVNTAKLQSNCNQVASDCISRQAALDAIKKLEKPAPTAQHLSAIFDCEDIIVALPSAQPDIVACGDCIHWICHDRRCGYWNHGVKPLDWCCHAERRTDE